MLYPFCSTFTKLIKLIALRTVDLGLMFSLKLLYDFSDILRVAHVPRIVNCIDDVIEAIDIDGLGQKM